MSQVSKLTKRATEAETDKEELERELEDVKRKLKDLKHRHDQMMMNTGSHMTVQQHVDAVADLKRLVS